VCLRPYHRCMHQTGLGTDERPARRLARALVVLFAAIGLAASLYVTVKQTRQHALFASVDHWRTWSLLASATLTGLVIWLEIRFLQRRPLVVLAALLATSLAAAVALEQTAVALVLFLVADSAIGVIAATRPRRVSVLAAAAGLVVLGVDAILVWVLERAFAGLEDLAVALTVVIAWMIGNTVRQRMDYGAALRAQAAAQAVTAERLRIARELHDMVAHSIGIIAIQAGAGSRVIETQPGEARNALNAIESTSREALAGLRHMLGALRQADPALDGAGPLAGLTDIDRLVAISAGAGVRVDVIWRGERRAVISGVDLAAFRIIQEAVTNVVRHAGAGSCQVLVEYRPDELYVEVVDSGRGCADRKSVV